MCGLVVKSLKFNVWKTLRTARFLEARERQIAVKMFQILIFSFVIFLTAAVTSLMRFRHVFSQLLGRAEYFIRAEFAALLACQMFFQLFFREEAIGSLAFLAFQIRTQKIMLAVIVRIGLFLSFENNFTVAAGKLKQVQQSAFSNIDDFYRDFIKFQNGFQFFVFRFVPGHDMSFVFRVDMTLGPKFAVIVYTVA